MIVLIESISPSILSSDRFRHSQDEGDGDFATWAETNPPGAFRRFQVRDAGVDEPPEITDLRASLLKATLVITVAYPHTARAGREWARDRDDCIDEDWRKILLAIGPGHGAANFFGAHDCAVVSCTKGVEIGETCDLLTATADLHYYLDLTG